MWQYYPLNSRSNNDFLHNSGLSGCHLGGNVRDVEKNRDNPRWKRANPARWVLGIGLFHSHWHEALSVFFNLRSCFFFLCVRVYYFREEVGVQLCCGGLTRLNALVWPVWNLLHITFEYMLPHCSFVSSVKTLSGNCVYKSICTRLSKIRMKCFFSFHYSLEFKRKPQIIWPSFRPLA